MRRCFTTTIICAAAALLAGCGGDGAGKSAATASSTPIAPTAPQVGAQAPSAPTATFVFDSDDTLKPPLRVIPRTTQARLVIISADGRPHAITARTPGGRARLTVRPGSRAETTLRGLRSGGRYRVVPDGATDPSVIQVG